MESTRRAPLPARWHLGFSGRQLTKLNGPALCWGCKRRAGWVEGGSARDVGPARPGRGSRGKEKRSEARRAHSAPASVQPAKSAARGVLHGAPSAWLQPSCCAQSVAGPPGASAAWREARGPRGAAHSLLGSSMLWAKDLSLDVLTGEGRLDHMPQTRWLQQQEVMFSHFWRLKFHDQGVGGFGFS